MPDFVIPVIGEALGHSPIYEEWKGDFTAARALADAALQSPNPAHRADALLASAIVQVLQGELKVAAQTLASVSTVATDPRQKLLAFAYEHLATMLRHRLAPGGGLLSVELESQWNAVEFSGANDQRWTELVAQVRDDATVMHAAIIYHVVSLGPVQRQMLDTRHSSVRQDELDAFLGTLVRSAVQTREIALKKGASPAIAAFLETVVADYSVRAGKVDFGRGVWRQAFEHYQEAADSCGMARCLTAVADTFVAPSSSPELWNMLLLESTSESSALTWRDEAREFRLDGVDAKRARGVYQAAADLFGRASARRGDAALALRRAWLHILDEEFPAAVAAFTAGALAAGTCGDRLLQSLARTGAGLARVGVNARGEDQATFEELGAWGKASGSIAYVAGLGRLATRVARHFAVRMGDSERARACYRMARTLYRSLGLPFAESQTLADLGRLHDAIGDRPAAIVYYTEALDAQQRAIAATPGLSTAVQRADNDVRLRLYQLYERNADPDGIERVIAGFRQPMGGEKAAAGSRPLQGWAEMVRQLQAAAADDADSFEGHLTSLSNQLIASTVETARVTANSYRAIAARNEGRLTDSVAFFARAMLQARSAKIASSDQLQAIVLAHQRRFDEAVVAYDRALAVQRAGTGFAERLVTAMEQSPEGQLERAMQQQRIEEQAATFMARIKQYARARQHLHGIERLSGADWWKRSETPWETLVLYGEVAEGLGELEVALERYDVAIETLERQRMLLTAEELKVAAAGERGVRHAYFNAARTALKASAKAAGARPGAEAFALAARAFRYMELGRARNLLDLMSAGHDDSDALLTARRLRTRIAAWNSVLSQVTDDPPDADDQPEYRRRLRADADALRTVEAQLLDAPTEDRTDNILELDRVRELIEGGTCVIEYAYAGEDLLVLAIRRDHPVVSAIVPVLAAALDAKIAALMQAIRVCGSVDAIAREIAAILLEPIASMLGQCHRLIIVPDAALHRVPFHLLPLADRPLMHTALVSYLPSASALRLARGASRVSGSMLVVGNPANMSYQSATGMRESLATLPGAAIEAVAASRHYDDSLLLTGDAATKTAVVASMGRYRLLHFATHGYLNATTPQFSGLAFANGTTLDVVELSGMRLDADLVVLSACDSGGGTITGGNDIIGLAHAFLAAGARALIVSLWPVNDWSAALIMERLYTGLRAGLSPTAALRSAQEALRRMTREEWTQQFSALAAQTQDAKATHPSTMRSLSNDAAPPCPPSGPRHWAAFVVIGAPFPSVGERD